MRGLYLFPYGLLAINQSSPGVVQKFENYKHKLQLCKKNCFMLMVVICVTEGDSWFNNQKELDNHLWKDFIEKILRSIKCVTLTIERNIGLETCQKGHAGNLGKIKTVIISGLNF